MPVSDRRPLGGVSQFLSQFGFWAEPLARKPLILKIRRDVRVVEGARLESVCRGNSTVGSNPTLSASLTQRSPHANDSRSLCGDEMGLGKTIQALAASEIMARQFGVECHFE